MLNTVRFVLKDRERDKYSNGKRYGMVRYATPRHATVRYWG
jgi:hypothetical protein